MDSLINAAAQALAVGDPLGALRRVALREDAPALALRGVAMAQLGDLPRARVLMRRAGRAFGQREAVARARCAVAEAEIALAARDLAWSGKALQAAWVVLEGHGDRINAAHAACLEARRLLLIGRLAEAEARLRTLDAARLTPALAAAHELAVAGVAIRRFRAGAARAALVRAGAAARRSGIPALEAEVQAALAGLDAPAARLSGAGLDMPLRLDEVETILASPALVVDGLRHAVGHGGTTVSLARRPVLFALARALGEAWPAEAPGDRLIALAFGGRRADESHRARLRVEVGRLRAALRPLAGISATRAGFVLVPRGAEEVKVLARPVDERHAAVLALLADGEAWSSSSLAIALDASQRTVQRALDALAARARVRAVGAGRARRWMVPPGPESTTLLLLPSSPPGA